MPPKSYRPHLFENVSTAGFMVVAVPVVAVIAIAIYLGIAALFINIKFARCTDQLLTFLADVKDTSAKDVSFGQTANEDLVDELMRRGVIVGEPHNAWGGEIKMVAEPLPILRLQTDLPPLICKRLALYLGRNAHDLSLHKLEAKVDNGNWITIFDSLNPDLTTSASINAACGHQQRAMLAVTVSVR